MGEDLASLGLPDGVARRAHAEEPVDGVPVATTLAPETPEALAATLRVLDEAGLAALPRGAGTQLGLGNPPRRADAFVSLEKLDDVEVLDRAEGVCHAAAGVPLEALRGLVAESGWELPLDDASRGGTLGGALASVAVAPRAAGFGRPRDAVLGLEVALVDGSLTSCGGRVVKNVTGYDLAKLYLGSLGALGVITSAWLRLRPRPEAREVLTGSPLADRQACERAVAWSRGAALRSVFFRDTGSGLEPWVELAGDTVSVSGELERLGGEGLVRAEPADRDAAAARRFAASEDSARYAVSCLPARLGACVAALRESGAALMLLPGSNLVIARPDAGCDADEGFAVAARAAEAGGGRFLCEAAPPAHKAGRDVFAAPASEVALSRSLKAQFDPKGTLNPGRFAGGV